MHGTGPNQSYSTSAKLLHWGFIGIFAYGIFKQVDDLSQLEDPSFLRFEFIFACVFLALLALRLWIMRGQGSALPAAAPVWNRMAAKLVHFGMYAALMAIAQWVGHQCSLYAWHAQRSAYGVLHSGA